MRSQSEMTLASFSRLAFSGNLATHRSGFPLLWEVASRDLERIPRPESWRMRTGRVSSSRARSSTALLSSTQDVSAVNYLALLRLLALLVAPRFAFRTGPLSTPPFVSLHSYPLASYHTFGLWYPRHTKSS